jgi:beta-lactamase superfamily II metal-dependent hydrolase
MLPADHGDCIWIEYGSANAPKHMLIDAGTAGTYKRLKAAIRERFGSGRAHFELFVITHIDEDHIGGAVPLLEDEEVTFGDVWFNGWDQITENYPKDRLGEKQAELVSDSIKRRKLPWNTPFGTTADGNAKAVVIEEGPKTIAVGDLKLTLLSPYREQLHALVPKWVKELKKAGLVDANGNLLRPAERARRIRDALGVPTINIAKLLAARFEPDASEANGSSIAFLLEYKKTRALFTGDAHVPVLMQSLEKVSKAKRRIDLLKLPHHGSSGNISDKLLEMIECPRFLVSTSGARFKHPDLHALARIVGRKNANPELIFNYESAFTKPWKSPTLQRKHGFTTVYPEQKEGGCTVVL